MLKLSSLFHSPMLKRSFDLRCQMSSFPEPITSTKSKLQIVEKKAINHDSYIYSLKWAGPKFKFDIGQHFRIIQHLKTNDHPQGEEVIRKYTPISLCSQEDLVEMLIKIYRPNTSKDKKLGGKLTPYLQSLKIGDYINIDGPFGRFGYKPQNTVILNGKQMKKSRIFFIAGGSGITPCYQTIREILQMKNEKINLVLLFANKTEEDILLKKQLEDLQPKISLHYTVEKTPNNWNHFKGYITKQMLQSICPLNDPQTLYVQCGPKGMNVTIKNIFETYYPNSMLFKY